MLIFKYFSKEIYAAALATTLVLLMIFMMNQLVHYLHQAASGEITTKALFEIMSMQVPLLIGYLLPLGLYIGILTALGRMYVDHEMTVLSACGFGSTKLLTMVMTFSIVLTVIIAWLMMYVTPQVEWYRNKILSDAVATASLQKILPGRFQRMPGGDRVFYAGNVSRNHENLFNVFLAQKKQASANKPIEWDVLRAKKAYEIEPVPNAGRFLLFEDGHRYIGAPDQPNYQILQFKQYAVRLTQNAVKIRESMQYWSSSKLWQHLSDPKAAAEFHWRLAMPVMAFILALMAVPMSKVNPRSGKFARLLPALILYIIYADFLFVARAWIQDEKTPIMLGMWWVHAIFLLIAIFLILRYLYSNESRELLVKAMDKYKRFRQLRK
ncbi:MAG: LPS export ABC transporter permease LptF [Gammaproteobacteria bacterium RIFCSPHIGHO2_12_FULL_41_15]|nr:MAG: LPS export ABC transporter permease LptF [Gammaproteobacteria bacterium RIFCSPHIGHO2_12_FULL_41_15]